MTTELAKQEQTKPESNSQNGQMNPQRAAWTVDEKKALAAVTFPMIEMQKAYGRNMDAKLVMQGWEIKFAGRFTVEQLLYALYQYTDKHDDFPSPSNLIDILEPDEPKVSDTQFIEAQKWQERNQDWSQYTEAAETIARYKSQRRQERENYQITNEKVLAIAQNSVKTVNKLADPNKEKERREENEKKRQDILASQTGT